MQLVSKCYESDRKIGCIYVHNDKDILLEDSLIYCPSCDKFTKLKEFTKGIKVYDQLDCTCPFCGIEFRVYIKPQ